MAQTPRPANMIQKWGGPRIWLLVSFQVVPMQSQAGKAPLFVRWACWGRGRALCSSGRSWDSNPGVPIPIPVLSALAFAASSGGISLLGEKLALSSLGRKS